MVLFSAWFTPAKLNPGITGPVRISIHEQIPSDSFRWVGSRLEPFRHDLTIQQKGKLQRKNTRLAGAIVATQQQAPIFVMKLFLIVAVKVHEPASKGLPSFALRM